jgi:hypothetical protein
MENFVEMTFIVKENTKHNN